MMGFMTRGENPMYPLDGAQNRSDGGGEEKYHSVGN